MKLLSVLAAYCAGTTVVDAVSLRSEARVAPLANNNLTDAMVMVGINPGAATTAACAQLKTLKEKFQSNLASEEEAFAEADKTYKTRICDGLGCETDPVKKKQYQGEWEHLVANHEAAKGRITTLLAHVEEIIESRPFSACPEFEDYLTNKRLDIKGEDLIDGAQEASA